MSCEGKLGAACAIMMAQPGSALARAFGGDAATATAVLEETYRLARAQADSAARPDAGASKLAQLRARAADQAAQDATVALFTYLRDQHQVPAAQLPAHGPQRSGVPLPRRTAQYGYQAVWDAIQAAEQGRPLPELAQQVWQARRPPALPGAVRVSADGPPDADYEYLLKLRSVNLRRLQHLELQRAHFGSHTPAYIQVEIEDADAEIKRLDAQIGQREHELALRADRAAILSPEQQREALLALARITGLPPERIKLIDVVLGSVILVVELPLAEAARLLAMQRAGHPALAAAGFAAVALERAADAEGRPAGTHFYRAVQHELLDLETGAGVPAPAPDGALAILRVTLAEPAA